MKKWSLNKLEIETFNLEFSDDIISSLITPVVERKNFKYNSHVVTVPRYFYRFIGVKNEEKKYYDYLCRMDRELSKFGDLYVRFHKGLDRNISLRIQNQLNEIWKRASLNDDFNSSYIINLISENKMFPILKNEVLNSQIKNNLKGLIDYYLKSKGEFNIHKLKLIVNYTVYWINMYLKKLFLNFDYSSINPKILYYGNISIEETFFLTYLSTLGCDIVYYNPKQCGLFEEVDKYSAFTKQVLYSTRKEIKPFPQSISERVETTAFNAKEELNKTLYSEDSKFYRPWQFADYNIEAVTLKTTYDEIKIWMKEKAFIRDGWKVENNTVFIPNIFAKISGTHEDLNKYWKELNDVIIQPQTKFFNQLPITGIIHLEYGKFSEVYPDEDYAEFDINRMLNASWWKYKELRTGLQRTMAEKIKELCMNPVIINKENEDYRDFQVEIFSVLINLRIDIMRLLQANDYPQEVPKMIIYNNEKNGNLSFEDCIMLTFLNYMGLDILIFNPSGYNDIEKHIYSDIYDIHRLENLSFQLDFKEYSEKKGFFRRIFGF